jgi:hypothetical protein
MPEAVYLSGVGFFVESSLSKVLLVLIKYILYRSCVDLNEVCVSTFALREESS